MRRLSLLFVALIVAGCSAASDDPAGHGADQDRQLNDAAAALDANAAAPAAAESPAP